MKKLTVKVTDQVRTMTSKAGRPMQFQQAFATQTENGQVMLAGQVEILLSTDRNTGQVNRYAPGLFELPEGWTLGADNYGRIELRAPRFPAVSQLVPVKSAAAA